MFVFNQKSTRRFGCKRHLAVLNLAVLKTAPNTAFGQEVLAVDISKKRAPDRGPSLAVAFGEAGARNLDSALAHLYRAEYQSRRDQDTDPELRVRQ